MTHFSDDIPEARRETLIASAAESTLESSSSNSTLWFLLICTVLGLGGTAAWWLIPSLRVADAPASNGPQPAPGSAATTSAQTPIATTTVTTASQNSSAPEGTVSSSSDTLLGHRPYTLADPSKLVTLSTNPMVKLKPDVAKQVETMIVQAKAAGIRLNAISGFRSLEDQEYLFFELKAERGQSAQTRAEVSAPPGYSEHHTGYAVDFIDDSQPATDLEVSFETTPAFGWLQKNAAFYGFEMSFPKDNSQNVAYEPWHWRYVGNQESLELFYRD